MKNYWILDVDTQKQNRLDVRVQFNDGRIYKVCFANTHYLEDELAVERFVAVPGLLILKKVSMDEVRAVLNDVAQTGYFSHLIPDSEGE